MFRFFRSATASCAFHGGSAIRRHEFLQFGCPQVCQIPKCDKFIPCPHSFQFRFWQKKNYTYWMFLGVNAWSRQLWFAKFGAKLVPTVDFLRMCPQCQNYPVSLLPLDTQQTRDSCFSLSRETLCLLFGRHAYDLTLTRRPSLRNGSKKTCTRNTCRLHVVKYGKS